MIKNVLYRCLSFIAACGDAVLFLGKIIKTICRGRIRFSQLGDEMYHQGISSLLIVILSSLATGAVLGLQGIVTLQRFGAKEFMAPLVALSLVRELSPVFTAFVFSGKSGAGITAELGTMNTNDQIQATRVLGVDPIELLVVPRFLACVLVLPILVVVSELVGIGGGYLVGVYKAQLPGVVYLDQTISAIKYVDFLSGLIKTLFFAVIIGWICCYQGYITNGGSLGVGRFTTKAVATSYMAVVVSNVVLTMLILTVWG